MSNYKKHIVVEPHGGLANRMRVISSVLSLRGNHNWEIQCIWHQNKDLFAPFNVLFEDIDGVDFINKPMYYKYLSGYNKYAGIKLLVASLIKYFTQFDCVVDDKFIYDYVRTSKVDIKQYIFKHKNLYINTCEHFGDAYSKIEKFKPRPHLMQRISSISSKFNSHTIGIHIRRTDHSISIKNSPDDLFVNLMQKEISENSLVTFFLSTDDPQVESLLRKRFKERIIANKKIFSRQSLAGVEDAVVDMFCLARTSRIYGSYWSSFNVTAAYIGKIKSHQLTLSDFCIEHRFSQY